MDINCSLLCKHQIDGKCKLYDVAALRLHSSISDEAVDCLYFESLKGSGYV